MQIEATILIGFVGAALSLITYFVGTKKSSKDEGQQKGYFEGVITTKLDTLASAVDKLDSKLSKNTDEVYDRIDDRFKQHIKEWHCNDA